MFQKPTAKSTDNQERAVSLCVNHLACGYDQKTIVSDATLAFDRGKLTVLVGPNGCGKSTLLKTIARILKPISGEILLNGKPLNSMPTKTIAQYMALLPQGPIAPEGLTVRELVAQGRFPHRRLFKRWSQEDSIAINQAMRETDTLKFADRHVSSLSGGQRQRCWLAMVLAQETEIILLDEPTTFFDLKVQVDVMSLLASICATKNRILLVVLHELNVAATFADHMIMMRQGRIVCQGAPKQIMTSDNIQKVFDLQASIMTDPLSNAPICVPVINRP